MLVRKRFIYLLIQGILLALLIPPATLFMQQRSLLYQPDAARPARDYIERLDAQGYGNITVETKDGLSLHTYFKPPEERKGIILVFHVNASHPVYSATKISSLIADGYGALLVSYRGYAGNPGRLTEKMLFSDGRSYIDWLDERPEYKENPRIYYGASLGSGVAVELAIHKPPAALILETPFLSALDAALLHYPYVLFIETLMLDQYRNDLKIQKINVPTLFLLAWKDEVVGFEGGKKLSELANEPKRVEVFPYAYHNSIYDFDAAERVADFLKESLK